MISLSLGERRGRERPLCLPRRVRCFLAPSAERAAEARCRSAAPPPRRRRAAAAPLPRRHAAAAPLRPARPPESGEARAVAASPPRRCHAAATALRHSLGAASPLRRGLTSAVQPWRSLRFKACKARRRRDQSIMNAWQIARALLLALACAAVCVRGRVVTLDSKSFEHLTQAATGGTTGKEPRRRPAELGAARARACRRCGDRPDRSLSRCLCCPYFSCSCPSLLVVLPVLVLLLSSCLPAAGLKAPGSSSSTRQPARTA